MLTKLLQNKKILYTIVGFLPLSVSLLFTPVYINYLSIKDYGFLNIYNTLIGLIAPLLHFGIKDGFGFLYWKNNDTSETIDAFFKKSISSILTFQLLSIIVFFLIGKYIFGYFFESLNDDYFKPFFFVSCFYAFFLNFNDLFFYYFRNKGNMKDFLLLNVLSLAMMTLGTLIGVFFLHEGLYGAIFGKFIGFTSVVLCFMIKYFKNIKIDFDIEFTKQIMYSGFPILLGSIIGAYFVIADKFFLQKYFSLNAMGIYGMALTIMYLVDVFLTSSMHFVLPDLLNKIKTKTEDVLILQPIKDIFHLLSVFCFLTLALCPLVIKIFPKEYEEVLFYIPFLCIVPFVKFLYNINSLNFYLYKTSTVFLTIQIITALALIVVVYFMPTRLYIYGAIIISLAYHIIQLLVSYLFLLSKKHYLLNDTKLFLLFFVVLFLLISLGILFYLTNNTTFYFIPFFIYVTIIVLTEKDFILKITNYFKNNLL